MLIRLIYRRNIDEAGSASQSVGFMLCRFLSSEPILSSRLPYGYLIFPRYNLIMAAIPIVILLIYADTEENSNQFLDEEGLIEELLRPILLYVHL